MNFAQTANSGLFVIFVFNRCQRSEKVIYFDGERFVEMGVEMGKHNDYMKPMGMVIPHFQDGAYFYEKGIEAYRTKSIQKAKRYLERAVQLEPKELMFLAQLAVILTDLGDYHRSNDCLMKIVELDLDEEMTESYFFLAANYLNLGLFEHARREALFYIEKEPDGEFLEEIEELLEILQDDDELFAEAENFLIRYELASHELENQNYDIAIAHFLELINEEPTYWMAHIRLAEAYFEGGNTATAISTLESMLKKEDSILAGSHLMIYLYEIGERKKVDDLVKKLSNVWSIDYEHCYQVAVCFGKVGEHELAYKELGRLQRKGFEETGNFIYHLAVASFYTGRIEKATKLWGKLATVGNADAITNLNFFQEGKLTQPSYDFSGMYQSV